MPRTLLCGRIACYARGIARPDGDGAMVPTLEDLGINQLSTEDRLALAEGIWESVAREIEQMPLSEGQRRELERRLADSIARPDAVTPWEAIKARALARAQK